MENNIKNSRKGSSLLEIIIAVVIILSLGITLIVFLPKNPTKNLTLEECNEYIKLENILEPEYLKYNDIKFLNGDGCYSRGKIQESYIIRLTYGHLLKLRESYNIKEEIKKDEKNQENLNNKFKNAEDISKTLPGTSDSSGSNLRE